MKLIYGDLKENHNLWIDISDPTDEDIKIWKISFH